MQMGRKGRNGQHAVAAGCCILGESAKCPAHHLHTALHTDLHTARGGQPHSRRKRKMSFIPPSYHSEAPIRSAKDLMVQMGRKERNGHHAGAAGCRILGEERNILHTTFTPFRGTDQISQGYYVADGTEGKKCHHATAVGRRILGEGQKWPSHHLQTTLRHNQISRDRMAQMGWKERNGHHAVAAGRYILGDGEKWPSHYLRTAL